jgi:opacity protein-like surface antigen
MKRLVLSALAALALAACATAPTVYAPAATSDAAGYRSNPDVKGPQVEDFALRRAAEITVADGYQWFRIVDRHTDQIGGRDRGRPSGGVGVGSSSGRYGSSTSVGLGLSFDLSPDSRKYETSMEILLGKGAKPSDPDAYDAQSILDRPR